MSKQAEITIKDAIRNAEAKLAKAKEVQCLALDYFNCDSYDSVEAINDIMMHGFSPQTNNGRMISHVIADADRLQRFIEIGFDYIVQTIKELQEAIIESKQDNESSNGEVSS